MHLHFGMKEKKMNMESKELLKLEFTIGIIKQRKNNENGFTCNFRGYNHSWMSI